MVKESEIRIQELIVRVADADHLGDDTMGVHSMASIVQGQIEALSAFLLKDVALHEDIILTTLEDCIATLPTKSTIYATVVALLSGSNPSFASSILLRVQKRLGRAIESTNELETRLILRFLAEMTCAKSIYAPDMVELMQLIMTHTKVPVAAHYYAWQILCLIPWLGPFLLRYHPDELDTLLGTVKSILAIDNNALPHYTCVTSAMTEDHNWNGLVSLWESIKAGREDEWASLTVFSSSSPTVIIHYYESLQGKLSLVDPHHLSIDTLVFPQFETDLLHCAFLWNTSFRIFSKDAIEQKLPDSDESLLKTSSPIRLEEQVIELYIRDLLVAFKDYPKECANQISALFCRNEYLVVQTILSEMFRLTHSHSPLVYYANVLCHLCRQVPEIPPVMALAMNAIFHRVSTVDTEIRDRSIDWFVFHISNFDYTWPWPAWISVLQASEHSDKHVFIRNIMERLLRTASYDRITQSLPKEFADHFLTSPLDCAVFSHGDTATELVDKMRSKCPSSDILACLDEDALHVFVSALFHVGDREISDTISLLERYLRVFISTFTEDSHRLVVLNELYTSWKAHPQRISILIEFLLTYRIVLPQTVVDWVLSESILQVHAEDAWLWEILFRTIDAAERRDGTIVISALRHFTKQLNPHASNPPTWFQPARSRLFQMLRRYQAVLWSHREILDTEIFPRKDVHPSLRKHFDRLRVVWSWASCHS